MKIFCDKCNGCFNYKYEYITEPTCVITVIMCELCNSPALVIKSDKKVTLGVIDGKRT